MAGIFGKALEEQAGLSRSQNSPHLFRTPYGLVVVELHMDDLHASGLLDQMLQDIKKSVESRVAVKHATICPAGENATFEHLRQKRIITAQECYVRANSKDVERSATLFGLENGKLVAASVATNDGNGC